MPAALKEEYILVAIDNALERSNSWQYVVGPVHTSSTKPNANWAEFDNVIHSMAMEDTDKLLEGLKHIIAEIGPRATARIQEWRKSRRSRESSQLHQSRSENLSQKDTYTIEFRTLNLESQLWVKPDTSEDTVQDNMWSSGTVDVMIRRQDPSNKNHKEFQFRLSHNPQGSEVLSDEETQSLLTADLLKTGEDSFNEKDLTTFFQNHKFDQPSVTSRDWVDVDKDEDSTCKKFQLYSLAILNVVESN